MKEQYRTTPRAEMRRGLYWPRSVAERQTLILLETNKLVRFREIASQTEAAIRRYTRLDRQLKKDGYRSRCATKGGLVPPHAGCQAACTA